MRRLSLILYALLCCALLIANDRMMKCFEYWIDNEYDNRTAISVTSEDVLHDVDMSALSEGVHVLYYRVQDNQGNYSSLQSWVFYRIKLSAETATSVKGIEYWFDEDRSQVRKNSITQDEMSLTIDGSGLTEGLHTLCYRLVDDIGRYGSLNVHVFYRVIPSKTGSKICKYRVWWNNHEDRAIEVQLAGDAEYLYEETLVVPDYARYDGYSSDYSARFHIIFTDDKGNLSPIQSAVVIYKDVVPPITTVTVDNAEATDIVNLLWTSNEKSANIYNVYYSENDEPYILWIPNTAQQEASFCGQKGSTYKFIVTSHDSSGNYEAIDESKAVKVEFK